MSRQIPDEQPYGQIADEQTCRQRDEQTDRNEQVDMNEQTDR